MLYTMSLVHGQIPGDRSKYYNFGARFFSEVYLMPTESPDSLKALVLFRISYSTLDFIKPEKVSNDMINFKALPLVEAEFKDSEGIIRKIIEWRDTIVSKDYDVTKDRDVFVFGSIETTLATDDYSAEIKLFKDNQTVTKEIKIPEIKKTDFYNESCIAIPIFANKLKQNGNVIYNPFIFENRVPFSGKNSVLLVLVSYRDEFPKFNYRITQEVEDITELEWKYPTSLSSRLTPQHNTCLQLTEQAELNGLQFSTVSCDINSDSGFKIGLLEIPLPEENLIPGTYKLTINRIGGNDSLLHVFKVKWMNMPLSLYNYEYAANMMYYILSDDELENIKDGSIEEVKLNVWNYWMNHDPSPNTLYNEAMQEYFERVDYTYYNYKTFTERDGAKSARGKIYILKGKPSEIKRGIKDGVSSEIWIYPNLMKKFVFTTDNNSNYELKEVSDIK